MIWIGLGSMVAFVPGWTGASIPTGWAFLALVLPWFLWRRASIGPLHWLGAVFLVYVVVSFAWAPRFDDAVFHLMKLLILVWAFWLGSSMTSVKEIWKGATIGVLISVALATAQWLGTSTEGAKYIELILRNDGGKASGLLYNSAIFGYMCALMLVAYFRWWLAPFLLWGLWLSGSRGAFLILCVVASVYLYRSMDWRLRVIASGMLVASLPSLWLHLPPLSPSDIERLVAWQVVFSELTPFGHGAGAMQSLNYISNPGVIIQPEYAHNDYLDLAYHFGWGAVPCLAIFAVLLRTTWAWEWYVLFACAILALFAWPMHNPVTVLVLGVAAGNVCRNWTVVWCARRASRLDLLARGKGERPGQDRNGGQAVPVQLALKGAG